LNIYGFKIRENLNIEEKLLVNLKSVENFLGNLKIHWKITSKKIIWTIIE